MVKVGEIFGKVARETKKGARSYHRLNVLRQLSKGLNYLIKQ